MQLSDILILFLILLLVCALAFLFAKSRWPTATKTPGREKVYFENSPAALLVIAAAALIVPLILRH